MTVLSDRWGPIGKRLWMVCNGHNPAPMEYDIPDPKSLGHGKVMPPDTTDVTVIKMYLRHMAYDGLIYELCERMLRTQWQGQGVSQVQITALDPSHGYQMDLLDPTDSHTEQLNKAKDEINQRYGELALAPASLINKSEMPNVIAPAWKPYGHRETIRSNKKPMHHDEMIVRRI